MYRSPNTKEQIFIDNMNKILLKIAKENPKKELILGMDHNMDLLKTAIHKPSQTFLDLLLSNGILPTITYPTRITQMSATLINNIFISSALH